MAEDYTRLIWTMYRETLGEIENPQTLYHYTNMGAAQKILEGNVIYFTNAFFMNDKREIKEGLEILWGIFDETWQKCDLEGNHDISIFFFCLANTLVLLLEDEKERKEHLKKLEDDYGETWKSQIEIFRSYKPRSIYLACFSEESSKDSLPMWYMYGDHAQGVSIGLDGQKLIEEHCSFFHGALANFGIAKVIYDQGKYTALAKVYVERLLSFLLEEKRKNNNIKHLQKSNIGNDFFTSISISFTHLAISHKNSSFSHENEWRLILNHGRDRELPSKKFIIKNNIINPIVAFDYKEKNVKKLKNIVIGPDNKNSEDWLKNWLSTIGAPLNVSRSTIPFRGTQ